MNPDEVDVYTFDDPLVDLVIEAPDEWRMVVSHAFSKLTTYQHGKVIERLRAPTNLTLDQRLAAIVQMINNGAASEDPAEIAMAIAWVNKRRNYYATGTTPPTN